MAIASGLHRSRPFPRTRDPGAEFHHCLPRPPTQQSSASGFRRTDKGVISNGIAPPKATSSPARTLPFTRSDRLALVILRSAPSATGAG